MRLTRHSTNEKHNICNFWDKLWEEFYKELIYEIDPDIVKLLKKKEVLLWQT